MANCVIPPSPPSTPTSIASAERRHAEARRQVRSARRADLVHPAAARRLMERVRNLLRVLLGRALSQHGQEAPALSNILIERASGRFEPRLGAYFANGYCTWAPVRPADCYAVCERYAAWDLTSLRRALLCEAHEIYARMCAEHLAEVGRTRERRGMAAALLD